MLKIAVLVWLTGFLVACSYTPVKPPVVFQLGERNYLYAKTVWEFSGRFALLTESDSVSASIQWEHTNVVDKLVLSGPFGQGRTIIYLTDESVVIDTGDQRVKYSGNVELLVAKHLGMELPLLSLKYWVLGLTAPDIDYSLVENGFLQSQWKVKYQSMQVVGKNELPKKIRFSNKSAQLKLIISQWNI